MYLHYKKLLKVLLVIALATLVLPLQIFAAASGTHTPVAGVTVGVSGATDNSMSNGAVTVTAKGSGGILGFGASAKTATITVTNDKENSAKVSFDWTATSVNQLTIDNTVYSGTSSTFVKTLDAGKSFTITITTAKNGTVNKLVMSNFSSVDVQDSSSVKVLFNTDTGNSVKVNGTPVSSGQDVVVQGNGATLTASTTNFVAWIDTADNTVLSPKAEFLLKPTCDMTVKAIQTTNACFEVGNKLFETLTDAITAASNGAIKTIVLANNGTLPKGDYTIPAGVTLLIPYDAAHTLWRETPTQVQTYKNPTAFRTLTMQEGANIVVNGELSLSATLAANNAQSSPTGACSFIRMNSGSTITVNSSGKLYAWGYIQGSGAVVAKGGATVYECFQIMDWRGGENTTSLVGEKKVFPFSQYYVQNVEVPMTLEAGAIERCFVCVYVSMIGIQSTEAPFIGADGMFNITSGHIIKDYDESTGRLLIDTYGDLSIKNLELKLKLGLLGSTTINSEEFNLPMNGNMTITMHSGAVSVTQDIALQPGVKFIVEESGSITLGSDNKVFIYDYDDWSTEVAEGSVGEGPSFCGNDDKTYVNLKYPTSATTVSGRTDDAYIEVNGTADLSAGYVYTTEGGANICGTGIIKLKTGTDTITHQVKSTGSDSKKLKYFEIPVIPVKLNNGDGTYADTAKAKNAAITNTYTYTDGKWVCKIHTHADSDGICDVCGILCNHTNKTAIGTAKNPTCTEAGITAGEKCADCRTVIVEQEEIPVLGHTVVTDAAVAPTCTTTGLTEGSHCSVCNTVLVTQQEVAALGHTEVTDAAVPPTCTETGLTEGKHCSVCNAVITAQTVVDALGHDHGATVVDPTCTDQGYTEHKCSRCGDSYKDAFVAALGHSYGEGSVTKEPTCTDTGEMTYTCSVCGDVKTEAISALDHDYSNAVTTPPTCTENGYTTYSCSRCDSSYEGNQVEATGHSYGEGTITTAPTCNGEGVKTYTCSACGNSYTEAVSATGHTEVDVPGKAATCTETGLTDGKKCSVCGTVTVAQEEIPKISHSYTSQVTKEPTCTEAGEKTYTCSVCGDSYTEAVTATGHNYQAVVTDPTCTDQGYTTYTCACGDNYVDNYVAAKDHTPGAEATCETAQTCTVCGEEIKAALGHDYTVTYKWTGGVTPKTGGSADGITCTATGVCKNDSAHTVTATATGDAITGEVTTRPVYTVSEDGIGTTTVGTTTYTAKFTQDWAKSSQATGTTVVATVNGTPYTTLEGALAAAGSTGETAGEVVLQSPIDGEITINQNVTINKNGNSADITAGDYYYGQSTGTGSEGTSGDTTEYKLRLYLDAIECYYDSEVKMGFKFVINDASLAARDDFVITLTIDGRWGDRTAVTKGTELTLDAGRYVAYIGIPSGEMARKVTAAITIGGSSYPVMKETKELFGSYTVNQYVDTVRKKTEFTDLQKDAASALAVYGHYAEVYFQVEDRENKPEVENLDLVLGEYTPTNDGASVTGSVGGAQIYSYETHMDSNLFMRYRFAPAEGASIENYTVTMNAWKLNKENKELVSYPAALEMKADESTGYWYVDTVGIPPAALNQLCEITVTNTSTNETMTVSANPVAWINQAMSGSNTQRSDMAHALYLYHKACVALFLNTAA